MLAAGQAGSITAVDGCNLERSGLDAWHERKLFRHPQRLSREGRTFHHPPMIW